MKTSITQLSPQDFQQLNDPPLLIDVRSQLEYKMGHVSNAVNLSLPRILMGKNPFLAKWVLPKWFKALPKEQTIAVMCLTSHRSPIAANALVKAGFTKVINISGGMIKWDSNN